MKPAVTRSVSRVLAGFAGSLFLALSLDAAAVPAAAQSAVSSPAAHSVASGQGSTPESNSAEKKKEAEGGTEAFKNSPAVQKIGGMLGMKPAVASSAFEWLNFLILAVAILYFAARALPRLLRGRSETIQKNLVEARSTTEEARHRLAAVEERLGRLDAEIASLRSDAERAAAEEEARLTAQVESEKKRILDAAEQEIAAASAQAQRNLRAFAAQIAVDRATAELNLSPEDDRAVLRSFAERLAPEGSRN